MLSVVMLNVLAPTKAVTKVKRYRGEKAKCDEIQNGKRLSFFRKQRLNKVQ
jgi:hypothetical protein